jgi:DNA-binding SARP family transcriptional activator
VAPKVFVEDMGRVRIEMAGQYLEGLDARRKVLELVCFLLTRPEMSATRDEVIDAVWPEADPASALNSLNQTLYFLRRVLEPDYAEDLTPNYVHHESDVVWLDSVLVSSRSLRLKALLNDPATSSGREGLAVASEYSARFALDFSYEEWAGAYRDTLHAAYLQTMELAIEWRLAHGLNVEAVRLARRVLEVDPTAEQIERSLIRAYHQLGARAAVREQYGHYSNLMRVELGVDPPTLAELIDEDPSIDMNT